VRTYPISIDVDATSRICIGVPATPVLSWDPVPHPAGYLVYLANDQELTNAVTSVNPYAVTTNTVWRPPSDLPDNTAHIALESPGDPFPIPCLHIGEVVADQAVAVFGEADDGGRQIRAVLVRDDFDFLAFHDGDHRVRGAQIDADDLAHRILLRVRNTRKGWGARERQGGARLPSPAVSHRRRKLRRFCRQQPRLRRFQCNL